MKKIFEIIGKDDELGEFVLDKRFNHIQGEINWLGNTCDIYLNCVDDLNSYEACLKTLKEIYNDLEAYNKKFLEFACDKLLNVANDWNENNEKEITREEFINNLVITSCEIFKDGSYLISYSCEEMFCDQVVTVSGNIETGLNDACLEG